MTYQIKAFAQLTGVSERTLRYYHEINLLVPQQAANGYREYTSQDADRLQLILMYRRLQFKLTTIKELLKLPKAQRLERLQVQKGLLELQQAALTQTLQQMTATIANYQEENQMTDSAKFTAFKQAQIDANQTTYGQEVVTKSGEDQQQAANQHFGELSQAQYQQMQTTEADLARDLQCYLQNPNVPSALAQQIFTAHQTWLQLTSPKYSLAMHRGIAALYVADERFAAYYTALVGDQRAATGLKSIIDYYTQNEE